MSSGAEVEWLQRAVELCSRGAVAYKAAFMLTPVPRLERRLLDRCTDRYALLERLLSFLLDQGMAADDMRAMLERLDGDPARHDRLDAALAEARACDCALARMVDAALAGELRLPKTLEEYLTAKRSDFGEATRAGEPVATATAGGEAGDTALAPSALTALVARC
jgi:hypothetical protein